MRDIIDTVFKFKHGYLWYVHGIVDVALMTAIIFYVIEALK